MTPNPTYTQLLALYETANNDAGRLGTELVRAELALKCLEESTVDVKAYEAQTQRIEALETQRDEYKGMFDAVNATTGLERATDELATKEISRQNQQIAAAIQMLESAELGQQSTINEALRLLRS